MNNHIIPGVDQRLQEAAYAAGLSCVSKDRGRTWKWGMADADGWPGADDKGWAWSEWSVDPLVAMKKLHELTVARPVREGPLEVVGGGSDGEPG